MYDISIFNGPFLHISEWINNINIIWEPSAKFGDLLCNNISFLFFRFKFPLHRWRWHKVSLKGTILYQYTSREGFKRNLRRLRILGHTSWRNLNIGCKKVMQHIQSTSNLLEKIYTSILFDYIVALILHDVSNSVWHGLDKVLQGVQLDLFPCPLKKFFKIAIYFGRSFSDFIVSSRIDQRFSIGFGEFGAWWQRLILSWPLFHDIVFLWYNFVHRTIYISSYLCALLKPLESIAANKIFWHN